MTLRKLVMLPDPDDPTALHTVAAYADRVRAVERRAPRLIDRAWPSSLTLLAVEGYSVRAVTTAEDILGESL